MQVALAGSALFYCSSAASALQHRAKRIRGRARARGAWRARVRVRVRVLVRARACVIVRASVCLSVSKHPSPAGGFRCIFSGLLQNIFFLLLG